MFTCDLFLSLLFALATMPPGWKEYLAAMDDPPVAESTRAAAEGFMLRNHILSPKQVAGLDDKDLQDMEGWGSLEASARAFFKRTAWKINTIVRNARSPSRIPHHVINSQVAKI